MKQLDGKVAFVTGAARGMGRAIATTFARAGADLVLCDVCADVDAATYPLARPEELEETRALVEREDARCVARIADVRDQEALDAVVAEGIAELGKIDVLIANAGIVGWGGKRFWETTPESWHGQLDVNLTGVWQSAKAVAPHMIERGSGSMVFTSSNVGWEGSYTFAPYVASKHAVVGLMRAAALELGGYGVRVNALLPGTTDTLINDNPGGRSWVGGGRPDVTREEYLDAVHHWTVLKDTGALPTQAIADAMLWLASDASAYVTGIELRVDGGHLVLPGFNHNPVRTDGNAS